MSGETETRPKTRRGLKIVLFVSLALNLAVAGLVLGAVAGHRFDHDGRVQRLDRAGGALTAALSREDRRAIGRALRDAAREAGPEMRPARGGLRAQFDDVIAALRAEPFDATALRAAIERQARVLTRRAELGQEILLARIAAMSTDQRAAYAERLEEVLEHGHMPGGPQAPAGLPPKGE